MDSVIVTLLQLPGSEYSEDTNGFIPTNAFLFHENEYLGIVRESENRGRDVHHVILSRRRACDSYKTVGLFC